MRHTRIPLADTKAFSPFFVDYITRKDSLKPFYELFPTIENFNISLTKKQNSFPVTSRRILVSTLQSQYKNLKITEQVKANIHSLGDSKTFTVTTGHQLNIFTGPLYFIFKIVTVINTCKVLKENYPDYHFVPVYWMASEDHDYDEIKYFKLYGKKYTWETKQSGAVGRFNPNDLASLLKDIPGNVDLFKEAYTKTKTLSEAVRFYVNVLFGEHGLVVVDADNRDQKKLFASVIREDILHHTPNALVNKTNEGLEKLGYKTQVFCRDINFFYLKGDLRSRIVKVDDRYTVVDTEISFSREEMESEIQNHPEHFSPNVILRPLYQEMILPNLAYTGGPAEVIYWLQLKSVFENFNIPFPILMPRNFGMVIDHTLNRKFTKTGLDLQHLFEEKNFLFNHWVINNSNHDLTVGKERDTLLDIIEALKAKGSSIDKTLIAYIAAEGKRAINSLEKIEKKLLRAEKRLHGDRLRQIEEVKDALFPNGSLQERSDNFLNFYQKDPEFISKLIVHLDPFDFNFNVLTYLEE